MYTNGPCAGAPVIAGHLQTTPSRRRRRAAGAMALDIRRNLYHCGCPWRRQWAAAENRPVQVFPGVWINHVHREAEKRTNIVHPFYRLTETGNFFFTYVRVLGQILHDQLHWLDVPDRILFKLAVTVHQCLNGRAPPYLSEHCIPVSSADTRRHLRSANRHLLTIPRFRLNTYGRRAFSVAVPMAWNSLPDFIRDPTSSPDCFRRLLKTYLFARY